MHNAKSSTLQILDALVAAHYPLSIRELAHATRMFDEKTLYKLCSRLKRRWLARAVHDAEGRLRYQITGKGRQRLRWVRQEGA